MDSEEELSGFNAALSSRMSRISPGIEIEGFERKYWLACHNFSGG